MKHLIHTKTFKNNKQLSNIFIPTGNNWKSSEEKGIEIIESGENGILFYEIIDLIGKAKEMVCLQSFLIQDTEIIDALLKAKNERGVRVFITDSAEARLSRDFEEDEDFVTKDYINMLNEKFKNNFVHRQANNLHAKFILIDPKTSPNGYLFTGNFNKKPFFENPELAVKLNKGQINELFKVFVYHFWEYTTDEQVSSDQFQKLKQTGRFSMPEIKNVLITSPKHELSNLKLQLIEAIKGAKDSINFSTFGFDIENEVSKEILKKLKSGIEIKIFCRPREKAIKSHIEILADKGAIVYCHLLIHAKSLVIDNKSGFVFSANFEKNGMDKGFDTGIRLSDVQLKELIIIHKNWETNFPYEFISSLPLTSLDQYYHFGDNGKIELKEIEDIHFIEKEKSIVRTEDLDYFLKENSIPKFLSKELKMRYYGIFQEIKSDFTILENITKGIDIIKYEKNIKTKSKKEKTKIETEQAVLLSLSEINNFEIIYDLIKEDYVGLNIFAHE